MCLSYLLTDLLPFICLHVCLSLSLFVNCFAVMVSLYLFSWVYMSLGWWWRSIAPPKLIFFLYIPYLGCWWRQEASIDQPANIIAERQPAALPARTQPHRLAAQR